MSTATTKRAYSPMNYVRDKAVPHHPPTAGVEHEVSRSLADRTGIRPSGLLVPLWAMGDRALAAGSGDGAYLVGADQGAGIEALTEGRVLSQLGATIQPNLKGNQVLPRTTAEPSAAWVAEGIAPAESDAEFDSVTMTPHTVVSWLSITAQLALQGDPYLNSMVLSRLREKVLCAWEQAALHGSGSSNEPTGIAATSGVGSVTGGENGQAPTISHLINLRKTVAKENAETAKSGYLSNPDVTGKLMTTPKLADTDSTMLMGETADRLLGRRYAETSLVRNDLTKGSGTNLSAIFYSGNWSDLVLGMWGGGAVDLIVDPYTYAPAGLIRITARLFCDVAVLRPQSFAVMLDAVTI